MQNYTNSPLVSYTKLSPNNSGQRTHDIDRITPHCFVGQVTVERGCEVFANPNRKASCNYVIGLDGRIALCVEEKNRSWCSGGELNVNGKTGAMNDQRAITIETASDNFSPYKFNEVAFASLIDLCADICVRYGKTKLLWLGDKYITESYVPQPDEMVLTVHRWYANKSCPGQWCFDRMGEIAERVTALLNATPDPLPEPIPQPKVLYRVQVGAFLIRSNAENMVKKVRVNFPDAFIKIYSDYYDEAHDCFTDLYKVQIGAFTVLENATKCLEKAEMLGYTDAFIAKEVIEK